MDWRQGSERIQPHPRTDVSKGRVYWKPTKSLWMLVMTGATVLLSVPFFSFTALACFCFLIVPTLLIGHSVGLHRNLIHQSFSCPVWLFRTMIYLGTLVGMDGPIGMMRQHDLRDWAQRAPGCHPYVRHGAPFFKDYWWQLHCDIRFEEHPEFVLEKLYKEDKFLQFMERTWMLQQIPVALALFVIGGWSCVIWGVFVRVFVSVTGHWLVGHFAHNEGPARWHLTNAGVQGRDVPIAAILSMGEAWHSNHHAYPGSAKLGLDADQPDPGWWFIKFLERLGLAWNIKTPQELHERENLVRVSESSGGCGFLRQLQSGRKEG